MLLQGVFVGDVLQVEGLDSVATGLVCGSDSDYLFLGLFFIENCGQVYAVFVLGIIDLLLRSFPGL